MARDIFNPDRVNGALRHSDGQVDDRVEELAHEVIGAAIEVHRELGPGFPEAVYEQALSHELQFRNISFVQQAMIHVQYKGRMVGEGRVDLLIADSLIVELKTVEAIAPVHAAQVVAYLKATQQKLGLLINFNVPRLKDGLKRIIL